MSEITIVRDDLVPYLESEGVVALIEELAALNTPITDFICELKVWGRSKGISLAGIDAYQIERLFADLVGSGKLSSASLIEGSNVQAASRPVSVGGIGLGSGNVWFSSYGGETWGETHNTGIFRFYVNGELKQVLTDYYITDLASLGAVSGDIIQICQVVGGVVGWWGHAEVS